MCLEGARGRAGMGPGDLERVELEGGLRSCGHEVRRWRRKWWAGTPGSRGAVWGSMQSWPLLGGWACRPGMFRKLAFGAHQGRCLEPGGPRALAVTSIWLCCYVSLGLCPGLVPRPALESPWGWLSLPHQTSRACLSCPSNSPWWPGLEGVTEVQRPLRDTMGESSIEGEGLRLL